MNLQELFSVIDQLPHEDLEEVNRYIQQRRATTVWIVPAESLRAIEELMKPVREVAESMSEEEINSIIDEAISEVRRERKTARRD